MNISELSAETRRSAAAAMSRERKEDETFMDKETIRREMLHMRKSLPPHFVSETEKILGAYVSSLEVYRQADTVMLYCSFRSEAGTRPLLAYSLKKKKTALPCTDKNFDILPYYVESENDLLPSPMGIQEPDPSRCQRCRPADIDLIIVPGVAFDIFGNRLGYGKGCYDRFLPGLRSDVPVIGLAYDFQVLPGLPAEDHDLRMDAVVTEKGLLTAPAARIQVR